MLEISLAYTIRLKILGIRKFESAAKIRFLQKFFFHKISFNNNYLKILGLSFQVGLHCKNSKKHLFLRLGGL